MSIEVRRGCVSDDELRELVSDVTAEWRAFPESRLGVSEGGWQGPKTLFQGIGSQALRRFVALLREEFGEGKEIAGWGNVMRTGDSIGAHDHWQSDASGVLFLNDAEGPLYFPSYGDNVEAQAGTLVLFGGKDVHQVDPIESGPRLSIAFNVTGGGLHAN